MLWVTSLTGKSDAYSTKPSPCHTIHFDHVLVLGVGYKTPPQNAPHCSPFNTIMTRAIPWNITAVNNNKHPLKWLCTYFVFPWTICGLDSADKCPLARCFIYEYILTSALFFTCLFLEANVILKGTRGWFENCIIHRRRNRSKVRMQSKIYFAMAIVKEITAYAKGCMTSVSKGAIQTWS